MDTFRLGDVRKKRLIYSQLLIQVLYLKKKKKRTKERGIVFRKCLPALSPQGIIQMVKERGDTDRNKLNQFGEEKNKITEVKEK